jgi:hypothetical protein
MTVSSIAPVARGFRTAIPDASPARISALLYLSQAWVIKLTGRPFFLADFIVDVDAGTITTDESIATDVATVLTRNETAAIKALASFYRKHTDDQLQALVKENVSWMVSDGELREIDGRTVVTEDGLRWTHALK